MKANFIILCYEAPLQDTTLHGAHTQQVQTYATLLLQTYEISQSKIT
jgi:hypothetical protein